MIVEHLINAKKCPRCGKAMQPRLSSETGHSKTGHSETGYKHIEYVCSKCDYVELDGRSLKVDTRYTPTFNVLPIIDI